MRCSPVLSGLSPPPTPCSSCTPFLSSQATKAPRPPIRPSPTPARTGYCSLPHTPPLLPHPAPTPPLPSPILISPSFIRRVSSSQSHRSGLLFLILLPARFCVLVGSLWAARRQEKRETTAAWCAFRVQSSSSVSLLPPHRDSISFTTLSLLHCHRISIDVRSAAVFSPRL